MSTDITQKSFAGGEFSPTLYGRSDLAKYQVALRRIRNFFVARTGAAVSRPGTVFCGGVKTSSAGRVRLIPFVYSDGTAYVLEFGNLYVRFWSNGAQVMSGMSPYEVATPYVTADLPKLKYAQQGAVLTLTHGNYAPAELTYTNATSWNYAAIVFDRPAASVGGMFVQEPMSTVLGKPYDPTAPYGQGSVVSAGGHNYISQSAGSLAFSGGPSFSQNKGQSLSDPAWWIRDDSGIGLEWLYGITEIWQDSRGNLYETAMAPLSVQGFLYFQAWNSTISYPSGTKVLCSGVDALDGTTADLGTVGHVYQSLSNGNLGNKLNVGVKWSDIGTTVSSPSPVSTSSLPSKFPVTPDLPQTITLNVGYANALTDQSFIGNRIYRGRGSTFGWIGDVKASVGTFTDYGNVPDWSQPPPQGRNPFKFYDSSGALLRTEKPGCCTFFEGRRLFARTDQRPGYFWGSAENDYANFDQRLIPDVSEEYEYEIASTKLEEIRFIRNIGPKLLLGTQSSVWSASGSGGSALTIESVDVKRQLGVGTNWVDPVEVDGALMFVRTKGTGLYSLMYDALRDGVASTDLTLFSSHLFIGQQIVDLAYAQDPWGLVYAVRADGTMLVLAHERSQDISAWSWYDSPGGGGVYENVCVIPEGVEDAVYVLVKRTIGGVDFRWVERQSTRVITANNIDHAVCLDSAGIYQGAPTTSITGLTWLEGQAVMALADGSVQGPFTVTGGAITLTTSAGYVVVGLQYLPELQQLDVAPQGAQAENREKTVVRVGIRVDQARGLSAGQDFNHLSELKQREVSDAFNELGLASKNFLMDVQGTWDRGGSVCIRQTQPLPLTVLGITREVDFGDE